MHKERGRQTTGLTPLFCRLLSAEQRLLIGYKARLSLAVLELEGLFGFGCGLPNISDLDAARGAGSLRITQRRALLHLVNQ